MLRMNVFDAGRHTDTRKRVDISKSASVACARALYGCRTDCLLWYPRRFVTHAGRHAETRKRVEIYKSVGCRSWDGDNMEKWMEKQIWPEWTMPDRAVLLVIVCVYEQKNTFYKIALHQQDLAYIDQHRRGDSPSSSRAATCNSL